MKTANAPCAVCGIPICRFCHAHRFPPKEAAIALSDKKHGEKKPGCACTPTRAKRNYGAVKKPEGWAS